MGAEKFLAQLKKGLKKNSDILSDFGKHVGSRIFSAPNYQLLLGRRKNGAERF